MIRDDIRPRDHADALLAELARSVQQAIDTVPLVSLRWLRDVVASGTAGSPMAPIAWGAPVPGLVTSSPTAPPDVALVVRVVPRSDASGDVGSVRARLNFRFAATVSGVHEVTLFEPEGLTANAQYDMVVMFVAGVGRI